MTQRSPFQYFKTSPEIIRLTVMLYVRYPLSLRKAGGPAPRARDRQELWDRPVLVHQCGPMFAAEIRRKRVDRMRSLPHWRWHLDEVFVKINGVTHYLWRAVDHEGAVLEALVTRRRDRKAALKFLKKTLKRYGRSDEILTYRLRSYGAALRELDIGDRQKTGPWANNRAENSHQPFRRRKRAMLRFRRMQTLQKFASVHPSVHTLFNTGRTPSSQEPSRIAASPLSPSGVSFARPDAERVWASRDWFALT